jgi:hypothetical protein
MHYLNERTVTVAATVEADSFTADRLLVYWAEVCWSQRRSAFEVTEWVESVLDANAE